MKKLLLLLTVFCFGTWGMKAQTPVTEAIDFTATDIHGDTWNLFELLDSGQYVAIDFFFCSCGPCQTAAPKINESYEYFGCNSGDVNYFAIDIGDDNALCLWFDTTFGVHYPTISGEEGGGTAICNAYQIGAYPTLILIAPDHSVVEQDIWPITTAQTIIDVFETYGIEEHECPPPVSVPENNNTEDIRISNIFPNPFADLCNISFSLADAGRVEVLISDITGRKVATVYDQTVLAGSHQISWTAGSEIRNGVYFCTIRTSSYALTQKMMLSR